jgi:hypothetical protein
MRNQIAIPETAELYVPDLDNHILIENNASGVTIRATRDNLSDSRRTHFIRLLAAEGYIPDRYEWFCEASESALFGVTWIVEPTPDSRTAFIRSLRKHWTRRNALYGGLFAVWLLCFIWAVRHTHHGLGL